MNILLIIAYIFLHLPAAIYKDTVRREKRAGQYGNVHFSTDISPLIQGLIFISSLGLAMIPLFKLLDYGWLVTIGINVLVFLVVAPAIAFLIYPRGVIYSAGQLTKRCLVYFGIGLILLLISL